MPVDLIPNDRIPELAERIDSGMKIKMLRYLEAHSFIPTSADLGQEAVDAIRQLYDDLMVELGLNEGKPDHWIITGNGSRALKHLLSQRPAVDDTPPQNLGEWLP